MGGGWEASCLGCGCSPPGGSHAPGGGGVGSLCHHLSCTGGLDNNYWETLKKIIIK